MQVNTELTFDLTRDIGGQGANSDVFLAHDRQLNGQIVIKRVPRARFNRPDEYFAEARILHDVQHPHVVEVKYACQDQDYIYLAMPHYPNGSLQTVMESRTLTVRDIVRYGLDFLKGLHHVHTRGLVHFDVKPNNVLVDASDKAALTDFGLAKYVDPLGLADQPDVYLSHQPPEAFVSTTRGAESDIYQSGLTLYRMCVGLAAFEDQWNQVTDDEIAITTGTFPDRSSYPPHTPSRLRNSISRALALDPAQRYPTALDLMNDLGRVDEWLDWTHRVDPASGDAVWESAADNHQKRITRCADAQGAEIRSERIYANGRIRLIKELSARTATRRQTENLLKKALTEL